ncbi:MAG: hypothetical protein EOO88_41600 [Pedobacter sp.]|nr:MAG: hypothetical protein EOO88_41600 [Pedobacter sp.]
MRSLALIRLSKSQQRIARRHLARSSSQLIERALETFENPIELLAIDHNAREQRSDATYRLTNVSEDAISRSHRIDKLLSALFQR